MRLLLVLGLLLIASPAWADIKIGVSAPLSGPNASVAEISLPGLRQAVADVNAAGGIDGEKIVLDMADDACDPKQGVTAANKLIAGGAVAVLQVSCSGVAQATTDIFEDEGVPLVITLASNPDITKQGRQLTFRPAVRDDGDAAAAVEFIAKKYPASSAPQKAAVVHDKTTWGKGIAEIVVSGLKAKGHSATIFEVNAGDTDFGALIARLKSEKYTMLYPALYMREAGLLVRQTTAQNYKPIIVGSVLQAMQDFINIAGPAREGVYFTIIRSTPAGRALQDRLGLKDNQAAAYTMMAYMGVEILADALRRTKGSRTGLAEALRTGPHKGGYKTIFGDVKFDAKGDIEGLVFDMYQYKNGQPVKAQ